MTLEEAGPTPAELANARKMGLYVGRTWHNVDTEDIIADLNEWLVRNQRYLLRWRAEGRHGENKLRVSLARRARVYARVQHEAVIGGPTDLDQSGYGEAELEAMLAYVLQYDDWSTRAQNAIPDLMPALADVSAVLHGMTKADRELLVARYGRDLTLSDIGDILGVSEDAARMRVKRSLERLRGRLWPAETTVGSRSVRTNASAQAVTRGQDR